MKFDEPWFIWQPDQVTKLFRTDHTMPVERSDRLFPLVGKDSLLFANGPEHTRLRRVIGPELRARPARTIISEFTEAALSELPQEFRLLDWTRTLTMRIIGTTVLGAVDDALFQEFTEWVDSALVHREPRGRAALERRLVDLTRPDALGSRVPNQLISLMFAGHETTASAIAWTLFWLERNENIRQDIRDELAATTDDGSSARAVPLLDAACRESLRLSPPALIAGNRLQPDGTRRTPCIYLAHHNREVYPQPERFDPHRFLGTSPAAGGYLPFGGGVRRCLGAELASLELRMVVAAVLRRAELRCPNPELGVPHLRGPAMGPSPDLVMVRC